MRYNILFFCTATQRQHGHEMRKEKVTDFPTQGHDVICGASTLGTDTFCKKITGNLSSGGDTSRYSEMFSRYTNADENIAT